MGGFHFASFIGVAQPWQELTKIKTNILKLYISKVSSGTVIRTFSRNQEFLGRILKRKIS